MADYASYQYIMYKDQSGKQRVEVLRGHVRSSRIRLRNNVNPTCPDETITLSRQLSQVLDNIFR